MRPGPTNVRRCGLCAALFAQPTLESGNTIRARCWTDGWVFAPMLPYRHRLVRCPRCDGLVWVGDQELVDAVRGYLDEHPEYGSVERMQRPTVEQYFNYLADHPDLAPADERYLRMHIWWFENHARRDREDGGEPLSLHERDNLRALAALVDPSEPMSRLQLAEIHRELGDIERASDLLEFDFGGRLAETATTLRLLIAAGIVAVRRFPDRE